MGNDMNYQITVHGCTEEQATKVLCDTLPRFGELVERGEAGPAYMGHQGQVPEPVYPDPVKVLEGDAVRWYDLAEDLQKAVEKMPPGTVLETYQCVWAGEDEKYTHFHMAGAEPLEFDHAECLNTGTPIICPWLTSTISDMGAVPHVARLLLLDDLNREDRGAYLDEFCHQAYTFLHHVAGVEMGCSVDALKRLAALDAQAVAIAEYEYAQQRGMCPTCGSENIEGDGVVIDGAHVNQDVECLDCGACWTDWYKHTTEIITERGKEVDRG